MNDAHPANAPEPEREPEDHDLMPRWVPVAIGIVLVTFAALAVMTGLRYRDPTLARLLHPRQRPVRVTAPAPPGEPEPGASLMFPGDAANVPPAREPARGASRAEITGGPGGVTGAIRMSARRGLRLNVTPADAVVFVNDVAIGHASQFDSEDEEYDFAAPGSYTVRVAAAGYKDRLFIITAEDGAAQEVARLDVKMEKAR